MSIPTLQQALETVFDTLEVLRYLRVERSILHRDISRGNVLYLNNCPSSSDARSSTGSGGANETVEPKEVPLSFVKYLLGESNDPRETSLLRIDFNNAENLDIKQDPGLKRTSRTVCDIAPFYELLYFAISSGHACFHRSRGRTWTCCATLRARQ
ncbi:hypothetical protein BC826DRAFT_1003237 [Russula brevipes]|nr:hypothetical protein BC826DRAFT_1003237 [Russula brevipes]